MAVDQLTKWVIRTAFSPGHSLPLLAPLCSLTYVQNTGAAFGLFKGQQPFFIALSLLIAAILVWLWLRRPPVSRRALWATALILGGTLGNLLDRVRFGYVVDFIDLHVWPVFNVADSAITIGVGLLLLQGFMKTGQGK